MDQSYAEIILTRLSSYLDHPVELTLYGRAALALGFGANYKKAWASRDVDGIIPLTQLEAFTNDESLWAALDRVNLELEDQGLYITHLFQEDQVFLRPDWLAKRVRIPLELPNLILFRLASVDLILTKMMRGNDEEDLADIRFIIEADRITKAEIREAIRVVIIPAIDELREAFESIKERVVSLGLD